MDNDKLLKTFIGKNYPKILYNKVSIPGFFFGSYYFLYRKMYLMGFILFLLDKLLILSLFYINFIFVIIIKLILSIFILIYFNKIYLSFSKKSISKIQKKYKEIPEEDILEICKSSGGTSKALVIALIAVEVVIINIIISVLILGVLQDRVNNMVDYSSDGNGIIVDSKTIDKFNEIINNIVGEYNK